MSRANVKSTWPVSLVMKALVFATGMKVGEEDPGGVPDANTPTEKHEMEHCTDGHGSTNIVPESSVPNNNGDTCKPTLIIWTGS